MSECLFCAIAQKKIPAHVIHEDAGTIAFLDIYPRAPGHTIAVSKTHSETLLDLSDEDIAPLFSAVKRITAMIQKGIHPEGFTIGMNHGKVSGQEVNHLHVHIIPRFSGDGGVSLQSVVSHPPNESLEEIGRKIRNE